MVINYCGEKCFKIQSGKLSIVSDPLPRFKGDIVLLTHLPSEALAKEGPIDLAKMPWPPAPNQISGPGEYEIQEVEINGFPNKDLSSTYLVKVEEMRLCFVGEKMDNVEPGLIEKLGEVDILFAPSGIHAKAIKQIQPKIVIAAAVPKEWEQKTEKMDKLVIKKKELVPGTKVVLLKE